jgi:hypothetical protein
VAGRHGVPDPERRTHARSAAGARRRRAQDRDAAQPWAAWLVLRGLLALLVLAAATWSVLLLTQSRGGIWPVIALTAGALSLLMIGLDVRARARQRARWRRTARPDDLVSPPASSAEQPEPVRESSVAAEAGPVANPVAVTESAPPPSAAAGEVPPPARRRSHRK